MLRRNPSARQLRNVDPELADRVFESGEGDDVDERGAVEDVVDGGASDTAAAAELAHREALGLKPIAKSARQLDHLGDTWRSGRADLAVGEVPAEVGGSPGRSRPARHDPKYHEFPLDPRIVGGFCHTPQVSVGQNLQGREAGSALEQKVRAEVGRRVHRLIALMLVTGVTDAAKAGRVMWAAAPFGGSVKRSLRLETSRAARVYFAHFHNPAGTLIDIETPVLGDGVRGAQADLVFAVDDEYLLIREVKNNRLGIDSPKLVDQVERLYAGGQALWGDRLLGVQTVPLEAPRRSFFRGPEGVSEPPSGWEAH